MVSNNIGTLRFIGAFLVLFGHGYTLSAGKHSVHDPISNTIINYTPFEKALPGMGVMMFFILSGFLITASFIRSNSIVTFCISRILRIYPALIVAVLFSAFVIGGLVTSLPLGEYMQHPGTLKYILHNSLLYEIRFRLPGVFESNPWSGGINGSLWTLPIEMWMYMLVAIIGILGILKKSYAFNATALMLILVYISSPDTFPLLKKSQHAYLGLSFLLGAAFYINKEHISYNYVVAGILLFLCLITYKTDYYNIISLTTMAYFILWIGLKTSIKLPKLDKHGDFSYGLYLYAFPIQQLAIYYLGPTNPLLINSTAFAGAMLLAISSWYCVEKPALKLKPKSPPQQ